MKQFLSIIFFFICIVSTAQISKIDSFFVNNESFHFGQQIWINENNMFIGDTWGDGAIYCYNRQDKSFVFSQVLEDTLHSSLGRIVCATDRLLFSGSNPIMVYSKQPNGQYELHRKLGYNELMAWDMDVSDRFLVVSTASDYSEGANKVFVLEMDGNDEIIFRQEIKTQLYQKNIQYGHSISVDTSYIVVGAPGYGKDTISHGFGRGIFFVFKNEDIYWFELGESYAFDGGENDGFGYNVFIDYPYILVGAPFNSKDIYGRNEMTGSGSSYLYKMNGNSIKFLQKIVSNERATDENFGIINKIYKNILMIGSENKLYLYKVQDDTVFYITHFGPFSNNFYESDCKMYLTGDIIAYQRKILTPITETYSMDRPYVFLYSYDFNKLMQEESSVYPELKIYPNPVTNKVEIFNAEDAGKEVRISVTDISGKVLFNKQFLWNGSAIIDLGSIKSGIYILNYQNSDIRINKLLMKQ